MRTIRELIKNEEKVYVYLKDKATEYRFVSDAEREGFTYGGGAKPTDIEPSDIAAVNADGTLSYVGFVGHMYFYQSPDTVKKIDYERYINGEEDYFFKK